MNKSFFVPVLSSVVLMLSAPACTPSKEDKPPQPKVTSATALGAAEQSVFAMPKLGPAPAWKLQDLAGKTVSSDQFKGKVVVVDFWATWCPPCRAEIPGYIALQEKYGKEGVVIIGVSLDQAGTAVVQQFADTNKINYQLVMGDDAVVSAFGGFEGIPTTFLIDRSGQIRDRKDGAEEMADYEKKIAAVLGEKA